MTPSEAVLWRALRANRFQGLRFRRQHPFGPYILDFYCDAAKLAVEVDGGFHLLEDRQLLDAECDAWVARRGVQTLRLPVKLVLEDLDAALKLISVEVGKRRLRGKSDRNGFSLSDLAPPGHLSLRERKYKRKERLRFRNRPHFVQPELTQTSWKSMSPAGSA